MRKDTSSTKRERASATGRRPGKLTHMDDSGRPRMVDVGGKRVTERVAVAEGFLRVRPETLRLLEQNVTAKGDPLVVAQIAGIQAAKRTAELIPLCHPLALTHIDVRVEADASVPALRVTADTRLVGRTGVEMEALTAVTVALLTLYDMLKATDRGMSLEGIRLLAKRGGRSGRFTAPPRSALPDAAKPRQRS